jgi:hypothetical protein
MLGVLVDNGDNQEMISNINNLVGTDKCIVFAGTLIPTLNTSVMQRYEAFHFNGNIITNSFRLCQQLPHLGYCKKRYYYVQNYEWMNAEVLPYAVMKNTLLHPNTDIVVQDASQVKLIEELTNKKVKHIMNNWDVNVLRQIANE